MKKVRVFSIVMLMFFSACKVEGPSIELHELGENNSKRVYAGSDLHMEFDVEAPAKIDEITVTILPVSGQGWNFTKKFVQFREMKNAEIHEHIDVPATAQPGKYTFNIMVKDMKKRKAELNEQIDVLPVP